MVRKRYKPEEIVAKLRHDMRGDTQRANPIASCPCSTDLIGLPVHFASSMASIGATSS
jgi:hypothetical protein